MITRRQFSTFVGTAAALAAAPRTAHGQASVAGGRKAEVAALRAFAEKTHPRGREAAADTGWRGRWDQTEAIADTLSDGAYFIALLRGLGWFGDGHTTPLPFEFTGGVPESLKAGAFGLSLPVRIGLFHDGAFVIAAGAANRPLLGTKVERIGEMAVADIVRANARDWPGNMAWAHRWSGFSLASPAHLQGLGAIADPRRPVSITTASNSVALVPSASPGDLTEITRPTSLVERWNGEAGRGLFVRPLPERRALYFSIDDMANADGYSFEQFTRDAFTALAADGPERVVVDLRRNGGGNNFFGEALRKRLAASRFNRAGGLYVLIGPKTFSAAQNLVTRLERETLALFVGEPTGGAPNHYGDAEMFKGEATGISSIVSTIPWFDSYPQDERPWVMPDVFAPETYADWAAGRDPALEAALTHRAEPQDELDRSRIFFYNRPSQKQVWRPFWMPAKA